MATIGQQLLQPESGWRRYDINPLQTEFKTYGNWNYLTDKGYNSTRAYGQAICGYKFNFVGDKLRIIAGTYGTRSSKIKVYIDGILVDTYSGNNIEKYCILLYEKTSLVFKEHYVKIECSDAYADYDAIDINENGELKPYNENPIIPYKYLLKQNSNYYSIDNNYIDLGTINNDEELDNLINEYGYDDLSIITKELDNKKIPTELENDYYKSFDINLNDVKDSINLIEEDDKKCIEYGCNNYKISDKIKKINDGKFEVLMKE
ncbi:TPA: hypothetical protein ACXDAZ_002488 [Clostridium botulinum]